MDLADSHPQPGEAEFRAEALRWLPNVSRYARLLTRNKSDADDLAQDPETDIRGTAELFWEAEANGLENLFDRIDLGPALERGLQEMQAEYREVVILVDVEDCTYAEAAESLGVPVGTIRSRLFRGRRLLQQTLIEHARDMGLAKPPVTRGGDERVLT
jgi:RNA polymerase sigma-70 factor (ECF subfamily)